MFLALSDFYSANANYTTKLVLHVRDSREQVIDVAVAALSLLMDVEVDEIIGPQQSAQASFMMSLGDGANVPAISFSILKVFTLYCQSESSSEHYMQIYMICCLPNYNVLSLTIAVYCYSCI